VPSPQKIIEGMNVETANWTILFMINIPRPVTRPINITRNILFKETSVLWGCKIYGWERALVSHYDFYFVQEFFSFERLGYIIDRALLQGVHFIADIAFGRQETDRDILGLRVGFQ